MLEGAYDNGKRSGTWKLYHRESGQGEHENALANISSQGSYDKGKRHGKFQGYYANGRLRFTVHFFSDTPDGEWQFFSQNGEPQLSGTFSTGTPVGPWRTWWEGGKRRYEGDYLRSEFGLEPITLVDEHLLPLEEWREVPAPQEPIIE